MRHVAIAVLALYSSLSFCQPYSQTIKGTVTDADSKTGLVGANILIADADPLLATVSDLDGHFRLDNVPPGRYTIQVSYVGYDLFSLSDVLVTTGKEVILDIAMKESVVQVPEVTIVAGQ